MRAVEKKMWDMIVDIVLGQDAADCLSSFARDSQEVIGMLILNAAVAGEFFANGVSALPELGEDGGGRPDGEEEEEEEEPATPAAGQIAETAGGAKRSNGPRSSTSASVESRALPAGGGSPPQAAQVAVRKSTRPPKPAVQYQGAETSRAGAAPSKKRKQPDTKPSARLSNPARQKLMAIKAEAYWDVTENFFEKTVSHLRVRLTSRHLAKALRRP